MRTISPVTFHPSDSGADMDNLFHQPQGGNEMPRFAGRATMMRLPF
ncbi:agmatinase, partial [Klebsiella pneumoniae]